MKFGHAQCVICMESIFKAEDATAFILRVAPERQLESVQLDGRQPWSGVRVICPKCLGFFKRLGGAS